MKHLRLKGIILALSLTLLAACGDGGGVRIDGGNISNPPNKPTVNFSVSPQTTAYLDVEKTIQVTADGTDFTVSPVNGAGCAKGGGNNVVCKPTAVGDHLVTLTATVDSRTVSFTVKVPEAEIDSSGLNPVANGEFEFRMDADDTESEPINLYASGNWTAEVASGIGGVPSWVRLRDASGDVKTSSVMIQADGGTRISGGRGAVSIAVTLDPNFSGAERRATVIITVGDTRYRITVIQSPTVEDGGNLGDDVSVNISPSTAAATAGQSRTFDVTAVNTGFSFAVLPASGHGCVRSGTDKIVCTPTVAGTYSITVTATENTSRTASAELTVEGGEVSISISPATVTIPAGGARLFTVTALNTAFTLSVLPDGHGCRITSGNVNCTPTEAGTYFITVTATADTTKTATAIFLAEGSVIVQPKPDPDPDPVVTISITPKSTPVIDLLDSVEFTVAITETENKNFTIDVSPSTGHGCEKSGSDKVVCVPTEAETYTLTVTAAADASKKDSVMFTAEASSSSTKTEELNIEIGGTTIDMRLVEAGTFIMGCDLLPLPDAPPEGGIMGNFYIVGFEYYNRFDDHPSRLSWSNVFDGGYCSNSAPSDRTRHEVTLTEDFYIGKYEVTQAQWKAVIGDFPRAIAEALLGDDKPMVNVSYNEALNFIAALNALDAGKDREWRLPTEAEWDYAAKGGNKKSFCSDFSYTCAHSGDNDYLKVAWTRINSGDPATITGALVEVGKLAPNELGLYDMSGNVGEMVMDFAGAFSAEPQTDPKGPDTGTNIVIRGGSYTANQSSSTVFYRGQGSPTSQGNNRGFRLALTVTDPEE